MDRMKPSWRCYPTAQVAGCWQRQLWSPMTAAILMSRRSASEDKGPITTAPENGISSLVRSGDLCGHHSRYGMVRQGRSYLSTVPYHLLA